MRRNRAKRRKRGSTERSRNSNVSATGPQSARPKMSALLADIAKPFLEELSLPEDEAAYRAALMLAAAIWNASTFPTEAERRSALEEVRKRAKVPAVGEPANAFEAVYARARTRHRDEGRAIAAVDLSWRSDGRLQINVASAGTDVG